MSTFLTNFSSFFSEEERKSELYRVLSTIGVNFERVILEELNAEIRRSTEISTFTENKLRSLLAFLLTPVRNVISATGFGRVYVNAINSDSGQTFATVKAGSIVVGKNGKEYQIQDDLMLNLGQSTPFTFVQGVESSFKVKYSEFISIPMGFGGVDLSSVKVFMPIDGVLTEIHFVPSFPNITADLRGILLGLSDALTCYMEGDLSLWNPIQKTVGALWDSIESASIRPKSGFFPFFFDNTLFIKIFSGGIIGSSDYVPDPNNKEITISYRVSDGFAGNIRENQLDRFQEEVSITDGTVEVTLFNEESFNGVDAPSRVELTNILRKRLFASSHVSSIPEYTAWFLAQPTVGDCLVVSDFERWRLSGRDYFSGFDVKGTVDIYLVDASGNQVIPKRGGSYVPLVKTLDDELSKVRDVAFLNYCKPSVYWHFFVVQYRDVSSDVEFTNSVVDSLFNLYSISWVRANNSSLFKDLSIDYVTNVVKGAFNVSGLRVIPYHYFEYENHVFSENSVITLLPYYGGKPGGWYEYWERDYDGRLGHYERGDDDVLSIEDGRITCSFMPGVPKAVYREYVDLTGTCSIYRYKVDLTYASDSSQDGWSSTSLWLDPDNSRVGDRDSMEIRFSLSNLAPGVLRCFWRVANEGLVSVGSNVETGNFGIRKLPSEQSINATDLENKTSFGEFIRFEKY